MHDSKLDGTKSVEFYFDFISPYAYFASLEVEALAAKHGRIVEWIPMLLGVSVVKVMGLKPLMQTPLKSDYLRNDVYRVARRLGLTLGRPMSGLSTSSVPAARAVCWVKQNYPNLAGKAVHAIYDAWWHRGQPLGSIDELLSNVEFPPGVDSSKLETALGAPEVAALLRESVDRSLSIGVFGAPTFVVDGEKFWGHDRMSHLDAWMTSGGW